MAVEGMGVPSFLVGMLCMASLSSCFNLEPLEAQVYHYPYFGTQGRESYFGFSVGLLHNSRNNTNWVLVGAPRANSSFYNPTQITEPGAMFKCNLEGRTCEEVIVDKNGNTEVINDIFEYSYQDLKNYGWLGGSLDIQPHFEEDRQVTGVCAPRWSNQRHHTQHYMNGVCYWMDNSASPLMINKELPLVAETKQTKFYSGYNFYHYAHGQAGMSIHFPDDQTQFIVGAPGVFNWHGSVILFKDYQWDNPGGVSRRRRQARHQMFQTELVPDPLYVTTLNDFEMFGYAVTSGRFMSKNKILYAGGAPRGAGFYGKVIVFSFPVSEYVDLGTVRVLEGEQLGEYFGAALTAADINGDGLTDLVVGSPMYSLPNHPDVGRIHTFVSEKGKGLLDRPEPHYGKKVSLARFGTSLASPGDLNADTFEDILVGAPWEDKGAVYVFLGSRNGLRQQYSQRLSPEDFTPGLRGFGMSMSRGIDIDNNGYPDVAIGSISSGHVAVVKTRPVALLSGWVIANPSNVPWEGRVNLNLTTCLHYKGYRVPRVSSLQVSLTLDHGSPSPRASFRDNSFIHNFTESLVANSRDPVCQTHQVTVKENKLDPDQPLEMKLEYDLIVAPETEFMKRPMTNPTEKHSSTSQVSISKGCQEKTCRVDMMFDADLGLGQDQKLVVGQKNNLVLRTVVSNSGEPAYLPTINVTVGPPLTLMLPQSHDCKFFSADVRTSLECRLSNPIKNSITDVVEVNVDTSLLTDGSGNPWIQVIVSGEGNELQPQDNRLFMSLPLKAQASLELYGDSKEEQVFYKHVGEDNINATINPRFIHTFTLVKRGPTPLGQVDLTIDIPVNITDGQKLVKLYPPKTNFLNQPIQCKLSSGSFEKGEVNQASGISIDDSDKTGSNTKPSLKPIIVSANKDVGDGIQYFNCSSSLIRCAQLSCHIYNWPVDVESAKVIMEMEVDLSVMAKHVSVMGGAVLMTSGSARIQSLSALMEFSGSRVAYEEVVTQIQPESLLAKGIPWWVILLAVLGGLLLLGLLAYGMYKAGFFKREKMEEMKAQQAQINKADYGSSNQGLVGE
ncbi:integrin alpha-PS3-like [Eriocheir sinensis]|uniref:integrin alpha-PS3-like n=1 Tax=Eriocheir sinensis TaxID=95602 RepID=UPI0021CA43FB|nr:integrin alpha-PS3-like [Eriocheir sinensis]